MKGGDIHGITFFMILCNASININGQSASTYTLVYIYTDILGEKAKINLHMNLNY